MKVISKDTFKINSCAITHHEATTFEVIGFKIVIGYYKLVPGF